METYEKHFEIIESQIINADSDIDKIGTQSSIKERKEMLQKIQDFLADIEEKIEVIEDDTPPEEWEHEENSDEEIEVFFLSQLDYSIIRRDLNRVMARVSAAAVALSHQEDNEPLERATNSNTPTEKKKRGRPKKNKKTETSQMPETQKEHKTTREEKENKEKPDLLSDMMEAVENSMDQFLRRFTPKNHWIKRDISDLLYALKKNITSVYNDHDKEVVIKAFNLFFDKLYIGLNKGDKDIDKKIVLEHLNKLFRIVLTFREKIALEQRRNR